LTIIIPANSAADTAYDVDNSCRFDGTSYLHKTPTSAGNRRTWTYSLWVKRDKLGTNQRLLSCDDGSSIIDFGFADTDKMYIGFYDSSWKDTITTQVFRDTSAWMHICFAVDTTQGTSTNRMKFYVNGTQVTTFDSSAYVTQNHDTAVNNSTKQFILLYKEGTDRIYSGYAAEVCMIDGLQLAPTSFGEFDSDSPTIWKPIDVSGLTFGTNGFYCDFEDSANLGNDANGGTDLTEVNLAAIDQTTDTPTNNFCTLNPLDNYYASYTFSEGNCKIDGTPSPTTYRTGTMGVASGKWYWEVNITAAPASNASRIGFTSVVSTSTTHILGSDIYGWAQNGNNGNIEGQASQSGSAASTSYGNSHTTDDIIGIALNLDDDEVKFYKNGTVENSGTAFQINKANAPNGFFFPAIGEASTSNSITAIANFGNPAWALSSAVNDENGYGNFEYSVPSGFLALCTKNLGSDGG